MSKRHSNYSVITPDVREKVADDDDFSFLDNLALDTSGEATSEEIIEALGEDDSPVTAGLPSARRSLRRSDRGPFALHPVAVAGHDDNELTPAQIAEVIRDVDDDSSEHPAAPPAGYVAIVPASASPGGVPNYAEMARNWKEERTRKHARRRQSFHRAKPRRPTANALAAALRKRTAKPRGDKRMEQLAGREGELARFSWLSGILIGRYGVMSDAKLADQLGDGYTRKQVWQSKQIVAKLQAEGGPWRDL